MGGLTNYDFSYKKSSFYPDSLDLFSIFVYYPPSMKIKIPISIVQYAFVFRFCQWRQPQTSIMKSRI